VSYKKGKKKAEDSDDETISPKKTGFSAPPSSSNKKIAANAPKPAPIKEAPLDLLNFDAAPTQPSANNQLNDIFSGPSAPVDDGFADFSAAPTTQNNTMNNMGQ